MPAAELPLLPNLIPRLGTYAGMRIREDTLYTDDNGRENAKRRKRVEEVLDRLQEPLRKVLEPEETILYVSWAQAPARLLDQLTFGWYLYHVTAAWLVFTNRRLLAFRVKPGIRKWKWTGSLRGVRWGDIAGAKSKGWLSCILELKYRNGKRERYWGLRGPKTSGFNLGLYKTVDSIVKALVDGGAGEASATQGMASLCPDCSAGLAEGDYRCNQCGLHFKDERTMVWRSLMVPGGGYFYVGQWFFGLGDFLVEAVLFGVVVFMALVALGLTPPDQQPLEAVMPPKDAWVTSGVVAFLLIIEKLVTIHHCRRFIREFIPLRDQGRSGVWHALGLASMPAVALLVWSMFPQDQVVTAIAPDLVVVKTDFGLFATDAQGLLSFKSGLMVPRQEGQQYGWVARLKTTRSKVRVREAVVDPPEASDPAEAAKAGGKAPSEERTLLEEQVDAEQGVLFRTLQVGKDDEAGRYTLRVYLEGKLVRAFTFELR